jgi:DNA-binding transcriptional ArsR family regulator
MTDEVEDSSGSEDDSDPKQKRLKPEEWREIEMLWEYDLAKTVDIARKFGITPSAVTNHFSELKKKGVIIARGAKKGEAIKALKIATAPAPPKPQSEFEAKKKERIETAKEVRYRQAAFHNSHVSRAQKAIQDGTTTWVAIHAELKAIQRMGKIIIDAQTMFETALGISGDIDEASLTILEIQDLTSDEIMTIQSGGEDDGLDGLELPELEDEDIVEEGKPSP